MEGQNNRRHGFLHTLIQPTGLVNIEKKAQELNCSGSQTNTATYTKMKALL